MLDGLNWACGVDRRFSTSDCAFMCVVLEYEPHGSHIYICELKCDGNVIIVFPTELLLCLWSSFWWTKVLCPQFILVSSRQAELGFCGVYAHLILTSDCGSGICNSYKDVYLCV